jgi:rhodanese-related sulfurtransferase
MLENVQQSSHMSRLFSGVAGFVAFLFFLTTAALASPSVAIVSDEGLAVPYCGIHSLYAAAIAEGVDLPFDKLVLEKYVGCTLGSTLSELGQAATDNGMYALPAANLSLDVLKRSPHPVILHIKGSITDTHYDHYVVFLGMQGANARILDAGNPIKELSPAELDAQWDGSGLIVSAHPISTASLFMPARLGFLVAALAVLDLVLVIRRFNLWRALESSRSWRFSFNQCVALLGVTGSLAFFYHMSSDTGLLASGGPVQQLTRANSDFSLPELSLQDVRNMHQNGSAIFIDARHSEDFAAGHLDGAISIPVDMTDSQRQTAMSNIPKASQIIVYCQSKDCPYARIIASALYADGYENLSWFRGGWQEWSDAASTQPSLSNAGSP